MRFFQLESRALRVSNEGSFVKIEQEYPKLQSSKLGLRDFSWSRTPILDWLYLSQIKTFLQRVYFAGFVLHSWIWKFKKFKIHQNEFMALFSWAGSVSDDVHASMPQTRNSLGERNGSPVRPNGLLRTRKTLARRKWQRFSVALLDPRQCMRSGFHHWKIFIDNAQ